MRGCAKGRSPSLCALLWPLRILCPTDPAVKVGAQSPNLGLLGGSDPTSAELLSRFLFSLDPWRGAGVSRGASHLDSGLGEVGEGVHLPPADQHPPGHLVAREVKGIKVGVLTFGAQFLGWGGGGDPSLACALSPLRIFFSYQ